MKKYKNIMLAVAVCILAASCESYDEYWVNTELNFEVEVPVDSRGRLYQRVRVDDTYITDYYPSRERLLNINLIKSWIEISNVFRNDRVTSLTIVANDDIAYEFRGVISGDRNDMDYIDDDAYYDFMFDVMDIISTRGYVDLEIFGTSNIPDEGPLIFTFVNTIDAYMRD